MKICLTALLAVFTAFPLLPLQAADLSLLDADCETVLQRYAEDPNSVPQEALDRCRDAGVPAAAALAEDPFGTPGVDPCAGPVAASLVDCWGPWAALAPAAGGADTAGFADVAELQPRPEIASEFNKEVEPLIVVACTAGLPCGYATLVDGASGFADAENTEIVAFELAEDGSAFVLDPDGNRIESAGGMQTFFAMRPDDYENLLAVGVEDDTVSRLSARVIRLPDDTLLLAADAWASGNLSTRTANSGFFAWGRAISQADLDALNNSTVPRSLNFAGVMSVDNSTLASMTVNFGTSPDWSGNWTNPDYSFAAGGELRGVILVSDAARFSDNVQADSFVQGALLGESGQRGIAHVIDVTLDDVGRIKDVGLLREIASQ
jgi:hypothetical protein